MTQSTLSSLQIRSKSLAVLMLFLTCCAETATDESSNLTAEDQQLAAALKEQIKAIDPLHQKMAPPKPGDWLAQHKETGQSFELYVAGKPVRPLGKRKTIYIQPLGDFTASQKKIVGVTAEFMQLYFNAPVKVNPAVPLSEIPEKARRIHPSWGDKQILSTYVLDEFLKPRLPEDAACAIAFTAQDLWPGDGWNFVFGQASLRDRVGVWSLYRNGDADGDKAEYQLCLLRTLKTAVHETGHMFSMWHCTAYECNMCGANNREESDRRDVWMCPQCVAKACWASRTKLIDRYEGLKAFYEKHGFKKEAAFTQKSIDALSKKAAVK